MASQINRHPGVSHNYERDHQFNLWFTLAVPPGADLNDELKKFNVLKGIKKVRMLPTLQLFKIGVKLDLVEDKNMILHQLKKKKKLQILNLILQNKIKILSVSYKKIWKLLMNHL